MGWPDEAGRLSAQAKRKSPLSKQEREDLVTVLAEGKSAAFVQAGGAQLSDSDIEQELFGCADPLMAQRMTIPLAECQSLARTSRSAVRKYSQMQSKAPALLVYRDGDARRVVEGHHRFAAAWLRGDSEIEVVDITAILDMNWTAYLDGQALPDMPLASNIAPHLVCA